MHAGFIISLRIPLQNYSVRQVLMAEKNTFLNAYLHDGYDPSSEFATSGQALSRVEFFIDPEETERVRDAGSSSDSDQTVQNTRMLPEMNDGAVSATPAATPGQMFSSQGNIGSDDVLNTLPSGQLSSSGNQSAQYTGALDGGSASPKSASTLLNTSAPASRSGAVNIGSPSDSNDTQSGTTSAQQDREETAEDTSLQNPVVTVNGSVTHEGEPIPLSISVTTDPNPDVMTAVIITGVPANATLSSGTRNSDGTWTLSVGQLANLVLTPEAHTSGEITLSVTAISTLGEYQVSGSGNFKLTIEGDASSPTLTVRNATGMEDMRSPFPFIPA